MSQKTHALSADRSRSGRIGRFSAWRRMITVALGFLGAVSVMLAVPAAAQIDVYMPDVAASPEDSTVSIPIHLVAPADTISSFRLRILLSRPDIIVFDAASGSRYDPSYWIYDEFAGNAAPTDSTLVPADSVTMNCKSFDRLWTQPRTVWEIEVDTAGALVGGWDVVEALSLTGEHGTEITLHAMADSGGAPFSAGITAADGGIPLLRLTARLQSISDTVSDSTVHIRFIADSLADLSLFDQDGLNKAAGYDALPDTAWYMCGFAYGPGDSCLYWLRVTSGPADSLKITDYYVPRLDSSAVALHDGSLRVTDDCCGFYTGGTTGNTECDPGGTLNLSDIITLISRVYLDPSTPLCCEANGDVSCDGSKNLTDITRLICAVYLDPAGCAPCSCAEMP